MVAEDPILLDVVRTQTNVTAAAVKRFRRELPGCIVYYHFDRLDDALRENGGDLITALRTVGKVDLENGKVIRLDLLGGITDVRIAHLAKLSHLRELKLHGERFTDDGLAELAGLRNLRELDLDGTKITSNGLRHLSGMRHLKWLWLAGSRITDEAVPHLAKLS